MENKENRRPLKIRSASFMQSGAHLAIKSGLSPNQVSILSIFFSFFSGAFLYLAIKTPDCAYYYGFLSLTFMVLRGFCNIFDGIMAIEYGKASKAGELFNDIPDRISDVLILVFAGYAIAQPHLGYIAALLALGCAYIRVLGVSIGAPSDFSGPMSKAPRMVLLMVALMLSIAVCNTQILAASLYIIIFGTALTIGRRARSSYRFLEKGAK